MPEQPNIVLLMADQWRGDCLGVAGHPVVHTPYLDQLALRGVRCTNAYSATPTCIAARAALFTGLTQRSHGRVGYRDGVPWNYPVTLAGEFTRHGYQTEAVGKMHVYPERSQMGFQHVVLHDGFLHFTRSSRQNYDLIDDYIPWLREQTGRNADYFEHGVNCNSIVARPWDKEEYLHPTYYVASHAIDFLRRRDLRKPFFLFISFHRPHPPYDPPRWAYEQYINRTMPLPPVGDWVEILEPYMSRGNPEAVADDSVPADVLQRARAGYYGHMTHIDHQVNRILESLRMYGGNENTLVMFTSDHGEMIGDHHLYRKSFGYEGSAHIPLVMTWMGNNAFKSGSTVADVIELRDVMPTLLEAAGLPIPDSIEGRSFLPQAQGKSPAWREYVHGEHLIPNGSMHWLTDGHTKYAWFSESGREQLFDLDRDPQECRDLAPLPSCKVDLERWRIRLVHELNGREEGLTDSARLIAGRPVSAVLSHIL